jgi:hypothetical protein
MHTCLYGPLALGRLLSSESQSCTGSGPAAQLRYNDGIAYDKTQKFLNTTKPTLFQQLRDLAHCEGRFGELRYDKILSASQFAQDHPVQDGASTVATSPITTNPTPMWTAP